MKMSSSVLLAYSVELSLILVLACGSIVSRAEFKSEVLQPSGLIQVHISQPANGGHVEVGSSLTLQCKFRRVHTSPGFKLRWMRTVGGLGQVQNQTITETDINSPSNTIIAATSRIWSVRRDNGLDLELNNFQADDSGTYYCRAVSAELDAPNSPSALGEAAIRLSAARATGQRVNEDAHTAGDPAEDNSSAAFDSYQLYSQENLSKLLPSLKIAPSSFNEIPLGEMLQLACVTSDLDPDPESNQLKWTFEPISDRLDLLERSPVAEARQLPYNVTVLGNILIIWSMLEQYSGLYKCTYQMDEFNLTVQASAEVHALTGDQVYSAAPLVFVKPELVRLSVNGSASIKCETTGYPPPDIIWYRVNDISKSELILNDASALAHEKIAESHIEGLVVEQIQYSDLFAYCRLNRCLVDGHDSTPGDTSQRLRLTGLSIIHLHEAKASHQGQYVCQASNRHGSNQATSIVDVEIKEAPSVEVDPRDRQQTITLSYDGLAQNSEQLDVTFRCGATAGRPKPRLRWLRTGTYSSAAKTNFEDDNLDLYDLTKVSSATTNVKTISRDNGSTLTLVISTISLDDEGEYICLGENEVGRQSAVARLSVQKPASIRILQASPHVAKLNDSFHLDCLATGHPIPMDIEWSRTDRGSFFSLISRTMQGSSQERAVLKFDRVTQDEVGEYTCNARDPINPSHALRDTIMVVVGDNNAIGGDGGGKSQLTLTSSRQAENASLMPKLMIRPTKLNAPIGSNVTLDCLAVSGLQPTLVEWLAPANQRHHSEASIQPYYRGGDLSPGGGQLLQFGSKLRIMNVSKAHEGIYQCKGKNKIGTEIAPAMIKVLDPLRASWQSVGLDSNEPSSQDDSLRAISAANQNQNQQATKTKVAKYGSNIELKCQVNGVEQPATSWSRDGQELPKSSVQIGHNLWIQNVTSNDNGLYVCSARSKEPNRIIQAKINLLVDGGSSVLATRRFKNLEARIVASKGQVNRGDSITLECIVSSGHAANDNTTTTIQETRRIISDEELEEIERDVVWTNLHSGQSLFQDNVYILGNLLIIYELKLENSATYRCNYNDLTQHTDYLLQVPAEFGSPTGEQPNATGSPVSTRLDGQQAVAGRGQRAELKQVPLGSRLILECCNQRTDGDESHYYQWTRGAQRIPLAADKGSLVIDSVASQDADLYTCQQKYPAASNNHAEYHYHYLVNVLVPVARFTQSPVSFVTLPTIAGANQQQLEIELKFLPETNNGLILFNSQRQQLSADGNSLQTDGDYLALGLVDGGYLEFKFELGDGLTSLRSLQPVSLNRWHRVMIERNWRGAVMWVDDQAAVSNSSTGKFFNLNLDSVLFVGGHQQFLYRSSQDKQLYGYSRGFQGCVSLLRIGRQEVNLMARNRSVAVGIFECHKSECSDELCSPQSDQSQQPIASSVKKSASSGIGPPLRQLGGICQIDRSRFIHRWEPTGGQISAHADLRCICMPGLEGHRCAEPQANQSSQPSSRANNTQPKGDKQRQNLACEAPSPCSVQGTNRCQSLPGQAHNCHCRVGFTGTDCSKLLAYENEHSIQFSRQSYLQLTFNRAPYVESYLRNQSTGAMSNGSLQLGGKEFNATNYAKQISMADLQNISFSLQTNSSSGLLFYTGQLKFDVPETATNRRPARLAPSSHNSLQQQSSKSMVVNLMSRLSQGSVSDYLAIALVEGHVEASFELGSGVAILRSSQRVNDNNLHTIQLWRSGKLAKLTIDQVNKLETSSPGKLSVLNSDQDDFYIGGLPLMQSSTNISAVQPSVIYGTHFANFVGCISHLEINSLGPLNLVRSNHLTEVRSAQHLTPCLSGDNQPQMSSGKTTATRPQKPYTSPPIENEDKEPDELKRRRRHLQS